ncbi:MAG: SRPBCC family protein [Bacteroidota bacterium]
MPKMQITKSITINAPVEKVYSKLNDFNHWTAWSPWLIMDPQAKVTIDGDAKSYEWEGDRVGSGNMHVTEEVENKWVDYDLTFLKPWKSTAKVRFETVSKGDSTEVHWLMDSSLPFFMFWMKKMMEAFVGMDYDRGLAMLKDYVEDGEVHSKLDFKGTSSFKGFKFVGIKTNSTIDDVGSSMEADFNKLMTFMNDHKDIIAGPTFSIYHKWDMVKRNVQYTSGIPVKSVPDNLPSGIVSDEIPATEVYTLAHTGPYAHLGNAWSTLYNMQRGKAFKINKKIHPFETYMNIPGEVPDKELLTEVHFPVK